MPSLTREIKHGSDQERWILKEMQARVKKWERIATSKFAKWKDAEERALAFMPERDVDAARRGSREGGLPQYTTIQIPYSAAVLLTAHTYFTSVFFARDPVFQFQGRHGETEQQVQATEALVAYQVLVGRMLPYLSTWLHDAPKYGQGVLGLWWDEQMETFTTIEDEMVEDPLGGPPTPTGKKLQVSERMRAYAGNQVYNIQPQDFIWDTSVTMREFQKGEFAGERKKLAWNTIIRREKLGYYTNVEHITKGAGRIGDYGSSHLERPDQWFNADNEGGYGGASGHPTQVDVFQITIEIIPDEWQLSPSDYPEKWVFTCTADYATLLGAQPLGARHCKYPYSVIPLEPEGYGLTTRGLPEQLEPIQNTIDWLINTHFYNVRASLNDRVIADPSRIVMKDLLDPLPGKVIRMKPEAYGQDARTMVSQMPVSNVTQTHLATDLPTMLGIGERAVGINDQMLGMLSTGGGRKTATEVRTSTSFGVNRLKTITEFISMTGMDALSMLIIANSQQHFDMELTLRIVGDLALNAGPKFLVVDPTLIAGSYDFVPVDGSLPIDRQSQVQTWETLMAQAAAIPQIAMGYDWAGIFTWIAQLAGLKNINRFRVQVVPDQMAMMAAQAGNSVPLGGGPSGSKPGVQSRPGYSGAAGAPM